MARQRSASSSSALVPLALGAAVLVLAKKAGAFGRAPLSGAIPPGGPYALLIFSARNSLGVDAADVATNARNRVAAVRYQNGVPWVVAGAATAASGRGEGSNYYTSVLVRVGSWMAGQNWSVLLDPLKVPGGGSTWVGGDVALLEATASGDTLDLARQTQLGLGTDSSGRPTNPGLLDRLKNLLATGETIVKVGLVVGAVGAGYLVWREVKPFLPSTYRKKVAP